MSKRLDDGQGSSKDTACQSPNGKDDSSHSAEEEAVEMAEFKVEDCAESDLIIVL